MTMVITIHKPRQFNKGDRVRIAHGSFVDHLFGTFIGFCGTTKAIVKLDGDIKDQRNLNRGSIRRINKQDERVHGYWKARGIPIPTENPEENSDHEDRRGDDLDLDSLLDDLAIMKRVVEKMEERVKAYKKA